MAKGSRGGKRPWQMKRRRAHKARQERREQGGLGPSGEGHHFEAHGLHRPVNVDEFLTRQEFRPTGPVRSGY